MPIEIRELHIRVEVNTETAKEAPAARQPPAQGGGADHDTIVAECVEQVVQILQARRER
jgi:hypothetical protein